MSRTALFSLALLASSFAVWVGASWSMGEVSLSCSKIGESQATFSCSDRIVHVLGFRPLIGLALMLAVPLLVASLVMQKWVTWAAVAALGILTVIGLLNWTSYWKLLLFAAPLAVIGSVVASFQ